MNSGPTESVIVSARVRSISWRVIVEVLWHWLLEAGSWGGAPLVVPIPMT
jgi:hypothetical protein